MWREVVKRVTVGGVKEEDGGGESVRREEEGEERMLQGRSRVRATSEQ